MFQEISFVVAAVLITYLLWSFINKAKAKPQMPPCPNPIPIFGNMFTMLKWISEKKLHIELIRLAKMYGGKLFTLKIPGQDILVVNSASTAREAMLKKRDVFAGRPFGFTFDFLSRNSKSVAAQDFNPTLLLQRKIVLSAIRSYQPKLEEKVIKEVNELVKRLTAYQEKPIDPTHEIALTVMNVICAMVFGDRYELADPEFSKIFDSYKILFANIGLLNSLNVFPFLIHFPIKDSINLKSAVKHRDEYLNRKYYEHQRSYKEGTIRDMTDALIKALKEAEQEDIKVRTQITEDHVVMTMNDTFAAGMETTSVQILWFLYFMIRHPDIQEKVQEELDTVLGKDSYAGWEDRTRLNYTFATIQEVARLATLAPIALPRKTTKDCTLEGYHIPKDTSVFFNIMALHLDENEWKDPLVLNPERFLDDEGKLIPVANLKSFYPFGGGRRICPGENLANQEVFMISSRLLQKFTLEAVVQSSDLPLHGEMIAINHQPVPFKVRFKERA
ncbi:steroid 17-alpha-hydroxylase/17,20 lyase [Exaiptasia diaphana]|uniref:Steroid 21-hydroxylase n=1 Tax=Exaiptasia diaphana TaxID=2652724 RepID=A0A913Y1L7_EXADI|nr:steroid 17-alpha-hydroxylase/17,20 lyase [Exaiptasia diaphana]